jgi:hypothetical protein
MKSDLMAMLNKASKKHHVHIVSQHNTFISWLTCNT